METQTTPLPEVPEEIIFNLQYEQESMKAFYFKDGQGKLFTYRRTRIPLFRSMLFAFISIMLYLVAIEVPDGGWIFSAVIFSVFSIFYVAWTASICYRHLKWKNSVIQFIIATAKNKNWQIKFTTDHMQVSNPDETEIYRLDSIKHASVKQDYIYLNISNITTYSFPATSMNPDEFIGLKNIVKERITNAASKTDMARHAVSEENKEISNE